MLNENIRRLRKSKGLTQEELASKLNVVRQTISKWEKGLSVPDSEMLIELSEQFEVPVSALLGETVAEPEENSPEMISQKLSAINEQLARITESRRRFTRIISVIAAVCAGVYILTQLADLLCRRTLIMAGLGSSSTAVIGGADGPTAIFVTSQGVNFIALAAVILVLVLAVIGIVSSRRKK